MLRETLIGDIPTATTTAAIVLVVFLLLSLMTHPSRSLVQSAMAVLQIILLAFPNRIPLNQQSVRILLTTFSIFYLIYSTTIQTLFVSNLIEPPPSRQLKSIQLFLDQGGECFAKPDIIEDLKAIGNFPELFQGLYGSVFIPDPGGHHTDLLHVPVPKKRSLLRRSSGDLYDAARVGHIGSLEGMVKIQVLCE